MYTASTDPAADTATVNPVTETELPKYAPVDASLAVILTGVVVHVYVDL
jgi:hypothetical protein